MPPLVSSRFGGPLTPALISAAVSAANKRHAMSALLEKMGPSSAQHLIHYAAAAPKCPHGLSSNGERCVINQIQAKKNN